MLLTSSLLLIISSCCLFLVLAHKESRRSTCACKQNYLVLKRLTVTFDLQTLPKSIIYGWDIDWFRSYFFITEMAKTGSSSWMDHHWSWVWFACCNDPLRDSSSKKALPSLCSSHPCADKDSSQSAEGKNGKGCWPWQWWRTSGTYIY